MFETNQVTEKCWGKLKDPVPSEGKFGQVPHVVEPLCPDMHDVVMIYDELFHLDIVNKQVSVKVLQGVIRDIKDLQMFEPFKDLCV